jgi:hypothetical protein
MTEMRFFVDTHNRSTGTFPEMMSTEEFEVFFAKYEQACAEEGVVVLRLHLALEAGRVFCFNMALTPKLFAGRTTGSGSLMIQLRKSPRQLPVTFSSIAA